MELGLINARLHGNGFLQYDLPNNHRLHIFHPDLIKFGQTLRTTIHTHLFDMRSHILCGELMHRHYDLIPDGHVYNIYSAQYIPGVLPESTLQISKTYPDAYDFERSGEYVMSVGSEYWFKAGKWHESLTQGLVVTVIKKILGTGVSEALVACPIGLQPDNEYKRDAVPDYIVQRYTQMAMQNISLFKLMDIVAK